MDSTMLLAIAIGATVACVFACVAALAGRVFRQSKEPGKEAEGLSAVGEPIAIAPLQHWTVPKSVECRICGKSVPSSQQVHPECDDALANAKSDIEIVFVGFAVNLDDNSAPSPVSLQESVSRRAQQFGFTQDAIKEIAEAGYTAAARAVFADRDLSDKELERLETIRSTFNFDLKAKVDPITFAIMKQALTLNKLKRGKLPDAPQRAEGPTLMVLKRGEQVIWEFSNIERFEVTTDTSYLGRSQGISVRIISGLSYRVGVSKGRKVETNSLKNCGSGTLSVTNKRVQFLSRAGNKSVDIVGMEVVDRFSDGIGITPKRGKAQIFTGVEPTFAAELILALASIANSKQAAS